MTAAMTAAQQLVVNLRDDVYIDEELNNREVKDPAYIEHLASLIESTGGLLQPIVIYATPKERLTEHNKKYELGQGYQRAAALALLAEQHGEEAWVTEVRASLRDVASLGQRHIEQLIENLGRKDLSPMETALAFKKAIDDPHSELTQVDLARKINWPAPTVSNYLKVANELCHEVQQLVLSGKMQFSSAKELVAVKPALDKASQIQEAQLAVGMSVADFTTHLNDTYKQGTTSSATDEAPAAEGASTETGKQKASVTIRAAVLKDKYIPKLEEDLKTLKGNDAKVMQARIDTIKFVLQAGATDLGALLKPWEDELQKKAEAEAAQKDADSHEIKYIRKLISAMEDEFAKAPKQIAAGQTPTDRPTAFKQAQATVEASIAEGKKQGLEGGLVPEGFAIPDVNAFMQKLSAQYDDHLKKKDERVKAAAAAREKKEAEKKAAEAGAVADGGAEASASTPTPVAETAAS